jgi:hypothetical protein
MLPRNESRVMPGRRSRSGHGKSLIRPHPEHVTLEMRITLVLGLGNGPGAPVGFHRARHHGLEPIAFLPMLGEGWQRKAPDARSRLKNAVTGAF